MATLGGSVLATRKELRYRDMSVRRPIAATKTDIFGRCLGAITDILERRVLEYGANIGSKTVMNCARLSKKRAPEFS
jgi:hypothetical protein